MCDISVPAFTQILENPHTTAQWLSDPDTGPMLLQISRIYHGEKNAAASETQQNSEPAGAVGGASNASSNSQSPDNT